MAKPGSLVVVQDIDIVDFRLWPEPVEWQALLRELQDGSDERFGNPQAARMLAPAFMAAGLSDVQVKISGTGLGVTDDTFATLHTFVSDGKQDGVRGVLASY